VPTMKGSVCKSRGGSLGAMPKQMRGHGGRKPCPSWGPREPMKRRARTRRGGNNFLPSPNDHFRHQVGIPTTAYRSKWPREDAGGVSILPP
jgi:hypothetical protein